MDWVVLASAGVVPSVIVVVFNAPSLRRTRRRVVVQEQPTVRIEVRKPHPWGLEASPQRGAKEEAA